MQLVLAEALASPDLLDGRCAVGDKVLEHRFLLGLDLLSSFFKHCDKLLDHLALALSICNRE